MFTRDRQDDFRAFCEHWGTLMKNTDYSATIKRHEDIIEEYRLIQRMLRSFDDEDEDEVIIREWSPHNNSVADYILSKDGLYTMTVCDTEIEHLEETIELHEKAIERKRKVHNDLVSDWIAGATEYIAEPPVDFRNHPHKCWWED